MNKSMLSALAVVALFVTAALAIPARAEGLDVYAEADFGLESFSTANSTASFYMEINNTGSAGFDGVSVEANFVEEGWDDDAVGFSNDDTSGEGSISLGAMAVGAMVWLEIEAPVPSGANPGDMGTLQVTVTADAESETVEFGVRVYDWVAYADGTPQTFSRGDVNTYDLWVFNNAVDENGVGRAIDEDIHIEYVGVNPSWMVSFDENDEFKSWIDLPGPHAANMMAQIPVYVTLNDNVPAGWSTIDLEARSNDNYMQPPGFLALYAEVVPYYGATMSGEGSQDATVEGGTLSWAFSVKNDGNVPDSFDLTWDTSDLPASWSTDAADGSTDYLNMNVAYSGSVVLTIPAGEAAATSAAFTLTVTSTEGTWSGTADFSASVAQFYNLTLDVAANEMTAEPANAADFSFTVTNTGNGDDTYTIAVETLATTYNPTAPPDTGAVAADGSTQFVLGTTVPADSPALASSGNITVTATSSDGTTTASATVSVATAQVYGLAWSYRADDNGTIDSISVDQGASGRVGLILTNTGNGADTSSFALSNAPAYANLSDTGPTVLVAGGETTVWVDLAPAADEELGPNAFQVQATGGGGAETSGDLTATVTAKSTGGDNGGTIDTGEEEDKGWLPGFGLLAALSALGAALLLRRRS